MPTYDYECSSCKAEFQEMQRMSDTPLTKCPECGADTAKRVISGGAGFILQGSGWYKDGYSK